VRRKFMGWILEKVTLFIFLTLSLAAFAAAQAVLRPIAGNFPPTMAKPDAQIQMRVAEAYGNLPLSFEPNEGQSDRRVKFLARGGGYNLFLTNGEAVLMLKTAQQRAQASRLSQEAIVHMKLSGANPRAVVSGMDELPGKSNYFTGNDPKEWMTDVPHYARVRYQGIYPGVDLIYYGNQGHLEYDFVVAAGTDPKAITLDVEASRVAAGRKRSGQVLPRIDSNGDLVVEVDGGEIRFHKPLAYQDAAAGSSQSKIRDRKFVAASYVLKSKNQVGIRLGSYDASQPLVIDPVVWYSSYLGGSSLDQASGIAVDAAGNVYVTGFTSSVDFTRPVPASVLGPCQGRCGKGPLYDAFVTKIDASGKALVYSTYLGGSGTDQGGGIAVDSSGNAYVTGVTTSADFPRVNQIPGACVGSCGSGSNTDAFVAKLDAAGNALVYSSLIGGSGYENDAGFAGIAVDNVGNAYVTGATFSVDFPKVNQIPGACVGGCGSGLNEDAFVTKINAAGSALVYSSYLGGSGADIGFGIAIDSLGNAYATGLIGSADFPRVNQIAGACNGTCGSGSTYDVYATKINAAGSALVYSSYIGGSDSDYGRGIAVDSAGNAYLAGRASSTDFPGVNQISGVCAQDACGAFATKINAAGDALVYSSRFGGSDATQAHAIAIDGLGNVYLTGETQSADFPLVNPIPGACMGSCGTGENRDGFITKIDAAGDALVYSSYLGGSGDDDGGALVCNASVAVDSLQNAYLSGCTLSTDFPRGRLEIAAPLSIPEACNGSCGSGGLPDAFVTKISK
jgi:hypothetical protein